jgi:hypothetical protein
MKDKIKERLIDGLQRVYDMNCLDEFDECTILDTIDYLGGEVSW